MSNFPLFLISFAIYNMIAFLTPGVSWNDRLVSLPMQSGAGWTISFGDVLIALSLAFLYVELRRAPPALLDRLLSALIFVAALAEFLLVPQAATSVFAILLVMALIETLDGWLAPARAAPRDLGAGPVSDRPA